MKRLLVLISAVAIVGPLLVSGANAQVVSIITTPAGSYSNSSGAAIAKVLIDHAGLHAVVQAQATNGLDAVENGGADFGLSNSFDLTFYAEGSHYYKGEGPHKNMRYVASFMPYRVAMFVRKNSAIKSINELRGKNVSSGFNAQKSIRTIIEAYLANGGLTYGEVNQVPAENVVRAAEDFDSGKTDVLFFALGSAAVKQAAATVGGLRALPLDTSPTAVRRMQTIMPGSYVVHVRPAPNLDGITKPTALIAFDMVLFTSAKTPSDITYRAAKALYENKKELAATFRPFQLFNPSHMAVPVKDVRYAAGALRFYKDKGLVSNSQSAGK